MGFVLMVLFIGCLIKRNYVFALGVYIISILGIPRNDYIEKLLGMSVNINDKLILDFRFLIIILMLTFIVFSQKNFSVKIRLTNLIIGIPLLCLFIIALINGVVNHNTLIKSEMYLYSQLAITIVTLSLWIKRYRIRLLYLLNMCIIGGALYSIISILLFIFGKSFLMDIYGDFYGVIWGSTDRITFQNVTALFIISFFSIYMILQGEKWKLNLIALLLNNISLLLSQTRSIIAFYYVCLFVILLFLFVKYLITKKLSLKTLTFSFIVITLISFASLFWISSPYFNGDSILFDVVNRFNEGTESIDSRVYTNQYIIQNVRNVILGNGIGYPLKFFSASNSLVNEGSWVDNLFLSIYAKFGVLGVLAIVSVIIYGFIINVKCLKVKKDVYFLIISVLYIPFIIITCILTSQLIHSIQVSIMYFIILLIPSMKLTSVKNDCVINK